MSLNRLKLVENETEAIRLIEAGIDANVTSKIKMNPMHFAAWHGYEKVIKLLIEKGYTNQINAVEFDGHTPLHNAAASYRSNCRSKLMK